MRRAQTLPRAALICLVFLLALRSVPAKGGGSPPDWPPISPEELAMKDNPADPGAPAMILYREQNNDDIKSLETHYLRIKVFKDKGKKYADVEIPYYEKLLTIEGIDARTIQPDGKTVNFDGEVFEKTVVRAKRQKVLVKAFTLPEVGAGSIIEYRYSVHWHGKVPDVLKPPSRYIIGRPVSFPTAEWDIQGDLFTRRARFSLRRLPAVLTWASTALPVGPSPWREPDGTMRLDVENIPAFKPEEFAPPERSLRSRINFFYVPGGGGSGRWYWLDHGKDEAEHLAKFMDKPKPMQHAVAQILSPTDAPETKLRELYVRAQQTRNLSFERRKNAKEEKGEELKENKNVEDVLMHGYGYGNEINELFVALAGAAGFEAFMVQAGGRRENFFDMNLLDWGQLTANVVEVRVGSRDVYLDPATIYCPFGLLPWEETGIQGVRLDSARPDLVTTSQPASKDARIERKATLQLADDTLRGKLNVSFVGQEALERRLGNRDEDEAGRRKKLEEEVKGWLPAEAMVTLERVAPWEDGEQPLTAELTIQIPNFGTRTDRRRLLPLAVFQALEKNPFQHLHRSYSIYFHYPYQQVDDWAIELLPGWEVEALPSHQHAPAAFASYEISSQVHGRSVQFTRRLVMDDYYFPVEQYSALVAFFNAVRKGDEGQIVLRKKVEANQGK